LTTFAGSFVALPAPVNWDYVFANADFLKNKTIYLTVISVGVLYLILLIVARVRDKNDIDKVRRALSSSMSQMNVVDSSWVSRCCRTITRRIDTSIRSSSSPVIAKTPGQSPM
jgi:hypothetical protein